MTTDNCQAPPTARIQPITHVLGRTATTQLHDTPHPLASVTDDLAALGRLLAAEAPLDVEAARSRVLAGALSVLTPISRASLTFWTGGKRRPITLAGTDHTASVVDELQYRAGHGPCLQALAELTLVRSPDLTGETRWGSFVRAALARTPVRGVVSCSLAGGGHRDVSLNLYADEPIEPDGLDGEVLAAVAGACSMALSAIDQRHRADNLERALAGGRRIGTAIGVLMASRRFTEEQAFEAMKRVSQHSNRKLRELADDIVAIGELPDGPLPWYPT